MAAGKVLRAWYCGVLALWSLLLTFSSGHFHGFLENSSAGVLITSVPSSRLTTATKCLQVKLLFDRI